MTGPRRDDWDSAVRATLATTRLARPPTPANNIPGWPTTPATPAMAATAGAPVEPDAEREPVSATARRDRHGRTLPSAAALRRCGGRAERVTVTRAAAQRSREMGSKMYGLVHRAATADGADKSGLTALTWPVVANFAVDAAMAVALANTLFFAAASGRARARSRCTC